MVKQRTHDEAHRADDPRLQPRRIVRPQIGQETAERRDQRAVRARAGGGGECGRDELRGRTADLRVGSRRDGHA